jgi:hypothetical protein
MAAPDARGREPAARYGGDEVERPLPVIDKLNCQYWEGARRHQLVLLRCPACRTYVHPPRPTCLPCQGERLDPAEVSGNGRIYS